MEGWLLGEIPRDALGIASFMDVVQLPPEGVGELLHHLRQVIYLAPPSPSLGQPSQVHQYGQVRLDEILHAGSLDLDHHLLAIEEPGSMDLADGGGTQRLRIELREDR